MWLSLVGLAKVAHLAELEGRYLEVVPYVCTNPASIPKTD